MYFHSRQPAYVITADLLVFFSFLVNALKKGWLTILFVVGSAHWVRVAMGYDPVLDTGRRDDTLGYYTVFFVVNTL